jgi:hypothetical protein
MFAESFKHVTEPLDQLDCLSGEQHILRCIPPP